MPFGHGSKAFFQLDNSSGTLTNLTTYITSISYSPAAGTAETSTLGKTRKEFIAGLRDAQISIEGVFDPALDAVLDAALGVERTFEFGPQGNTVGSVRYTGEAICTAYEASVDMGDAGRWTATLQPTGTVARNTF